MKSRAAPLLMSLLLLAPGARSAAAQPFPAPLERSWMNAWPAGAPATGFAPALWFDGTRLGYGVAGTASFGLGARQGPADAAARAGLAPRAAPPGARLELGLRGAGAGAWSASSSGAMSLRLHYSGEHAGAWLATGGLMTGNEPARLPLAGGGFWMRRGPLTLTTQVVQLLRAIHVRGPAPQQAEGPADSAGVVRFPGPSYPSDDIRLLTGLEVGLGWTGARFDVDGRAGVARGPHPPLGRWAELRAAFWATPGVALFAGVRTTAHVAGALESVQGNRAAVGIQIAPGRRREPDAQAPRRTPPAITVERVGAAAARVVFTLEARSLDVSCDANGWTPVSAVAAGWNRWEVVLPLSPGLHRIAIRVDGGAWRAPPGLPKAEDDFGGEVGLLVVG